MQNDTANRLGWKNLNQCEVFTSFLHELSLRTFVARSFFPHAEVFPPRLPNHSMSAPLQSHFRRRTTIEKDEFKQTFTDFFYSWLSLASCDDTNTASSTPRQAATILGVTLSGTKPCPFQEDGNFCNMRSFGHIGAEAAVPAPQQPLRSCWWTRDCPKASPSSKWMQLPMCLCNLRNL